MITRFNNTFKKILRLAQAIIILLNCSCIASKDVNDDITCLRKINTDITKEIRKQIGDEYDSKKTNIKLILQFYINANSNADSIVVSKSNLKEFSIDEKELVKNLEKYKYDCMREVYYNKELKPNYITVIFNPKLIN
jgi:hypothetical protein